MILSEKVIAKWNSSIRKHYELLGYVYTKRGEEFKVLVEHLTSSSGILVEFVCDYCNGENQKSEKDRWKRYADILKQRSSVNKDCCYSQECRSKKLSEAALLKSIPTRTSVAKKLPHLIKEWSEKNAETPFEKSYLSTEEVWWKCPEGHEWKESIYNRSRQKKTTCPNCTSLLTINPSLSKEWHPTKNGNLAPKDVMPNSGKKVWWLGECNHEWDASIASRNHSGQGCPYCAGQKVHSGNSLVTLYPEIAKEWHPVKNGTLKAEAFTRGSKKKVWWQCSSCNNEWEAQIKDRTTKRTGCPECKKNNQSSFDEQSVYYYLKKVFEKTENKKRINKDQMEIDVYVPEVNLAIEYDSYFYHKDKMKVDERKNRFLKEQNIFLIRIRESKLTSIDMEGFPVFYRDNKSSEEELTKIITHILKYIKENFHVTAKQREKLDKINVNVEKDSFKIMNSYKLLKKDNSLANLRLDIVEEWNVEKNEGLNPDNFSVKSRRKVWWICKDCNHEWKASIGDRTRDNKSTNCPKCARRITGEKNRANKLNDKNRLSICYPEMAKQWVYEKNDNFTPETISSNSRFNAWWRCEKGHEFQGSVVVRTSRNIICPYCSNKRVNNENCVATTHPEILKEWDYKKNSETTPHTVTYGYDKKVWWICSDCGLEEFEVIRNRFTRQSKKKRCKLCSSFLKKHPEKAREWHPTKNGELNPANIYPNSMTKIWWKCDKGHEWEATVASRKRGGACPECRYIKSQESKLLQKEKMNKGLSKD
ncbi:zinc-ribbon domain-containing protein [Priestia megaterium]|uniref:zinc-ribbon domain-containing protein n=1 Tax=Priestia megaterium TaxID=1404 RepID=UPI0027954715|nr:zinc-ribbon domain-containing protein [Priestia megaterium]